MDFWQTRGGLEFQYKLLRQLTRIADGIEVQNQYYERLVGDVPYGTGRTEDESLDPEPADLAYYSKNCDNCEEDKCQPFIAKAVWLHDDDGNEVMQHCRCTCTCHLEEKEITV